MNTRRILAIMLIIVLCSPLGMAQLVQTKPITLDKAAFDQNLTSAVGPQVMGYQFVLIKDGKVVSEKADGTARTAADGGPTTMTLKTPLNIGSLQKFITGTAMLNLMENPAVYSPDRNQSLSVRLNRQISTLFPGVWLKRMKNGVEKITFRQLLQHRSGFNGFGSTSPRYKSQNRNVLGFLRDDDGFLADRYDVRDYANINFVMTGYMLPLYQRPDVAKLLNNSIGEGQMADVPADNYIKNELGKEMHQMFTERIFSKMKPQIKPSCDAVNELKDTVGYGYETKNATKGIISSAIDKQGNCSGEGGYYMSARDFANYVAHFSASDLIVSQKGRDAMFREGMAANDRLVWTSASQDPWMQKNFQMSFVASSNGIPGAGRTVLIRLPQNYYLILFTNSDELSTTQLYNIGVAAFKAGMQHNFKS